MSFLVATHLLIFYLNFRADGFSHDGLGVNGTHCVRVLRKTGIFSQVKCVRTAAEIDAAIQADPTVTHVLIEAPWLPAESIIKFMRKWPRIVFACRLHAQISFLQVDNGAMKNLRGYQVMQDGDVNFHVCSNSKRFCDWFQLTYNSYCTFLPNLYDLERPNLKPIAPHAHRILRISSFGALRPMKNHLTSAAAALQIAKARGCDLEFWVSTGRDEQHGVLPGLRNLFGAHPWAKLVGNTWQQWAEFRHTVAQMDLSLQESYTETFNIVTADAVAEGVPVVGSPAIEWLPSFCQANPDDAAEIARVGNTLLSAPNLRLEALAALKKHVSDGVRLWLDFLN
jgi:glycosyltransferase involved in cell wall biosynthesis